MARPGRPPLGALLDAPLDSLLDALLDAVAAAAAASPASLRRCLSRLAVDAAAVVTGARPAAMLDYAPALSPSAAAALAAGLEAAGGARVQAAVLDGCCYLVGPGLCGMRGVGGVGGVGGVPAAPDAPAPPATSVAPPAMPWPLTLAPGVPPVWAPPSRRHDLAVALRTVSIALQAGNGGSAVDLGPAAAACAASAALAPPAINAWLLGYPVAYDVAPDPAAACAAAATLGGGAGAATTFSLTVAAPVLDAALARRGWPPPASSLGGGGDGVELCSFSLPAGLDDRAGPGEGWATAWVDGVAATLRPPFTRARLASSPVRACLAL